MILSVRAGRPMRRDDVWLRKTHNEIAIYDSKTGSVHLLNETALAIWELCDGETLPDEMIAAVCDLCGMHADIVTEDIGRILRDFERAGLVSWRD